MSRLNLPDIQGNILRPYGRLGFPFTRHFFFNIGDPGAGRGFVQAIWPRVTTAERWTTGEAAPGSTAPAKPTITLNIGFTYLGLRALDLPTRTLRLLPDEFIDGMGCRAEILGDVGQSAPEHWDPIWRFKPEDRARQPHVWVSLNAAAAPDGTPLPVLEDWTMWLEGLAAGSSGAVTLLAGHGADGAARWQDSAALMDGPAGARRPIPKEHFGFTDGVGDPVFAGQFEGAAQAIAVIGGGKIASGPYDQRTSWSPLETGEFILGQVDEGQEFPVATQPAAFARNGTFMVWRKLSQNTTAFDAEMTRQATVWKQVTGGADDVEAEETVRAKIVGRWRSGLPLIAAPTWADHNRIMGEYADCIEIALRRPRDDKERRRLADYDLLLSGFRYGDDRDGARCPLGAHIRRGNPRDMLDPTLSASQGASTLTNRRRILRRGLPYEDLGGEKGVVFMAICASIFRQFEFIQQQWMNYGLDFEAGADACPLIGDRSQSDKHVVPAGAPGQAPFIVAGLPQFVATRGGDYLFLPSLNAIRMIAMGTVDPT